MTTTEAPAATGATTTQRRLYAVLIVLAIGIAGLVGYSIRAKQDANAQVSTGRAYLGTNQGAVKVDGIAFGFTGDSNSMTWFDARGEQHEGGIPPCMQHRPGYANIRFGHVQAPLPDHSSMPVVTWVQCLPAG